ncbi:MAG: hypothetical protein JJU18_06900 [Oceanicaulis sp.]|nr:hypothetical protein [Oceanicaulis sp.]
MIDKREPLPDSYALLTEPAPVEAAAGYLIEMLNSMAAFAHKSNLSNSSVFLNAAAMITWQECKLRTHGPPEFREGVDIIWPDGFAPGD